MNREQEQLLREQKSERSFAADARRTLHRSKKVPIRDSGDKPPKPSEVVTIRVEPIVWEKALELARDNVRRIKVLSETEVVVLNQ